MTMKKKREKKKMDKGKSKIKRTQRSPKKMGSKSPRKIDKSQKITMTSRK